MSLGAELLHGLCLMGGQHVGYYPRNARLGGNGFRRGSVVAGEHYHVEARLLHGLHGGDGIRFQHVRRRDGSQIPAFPVRKIQRGLSLFPEIRVIRDVDANLLHQLGVAAIIGYVINDAGHALTGQGAEILHISQRRTAVFHTNRLGKGVFGWCFQRSRKGKQFCFTD